MPVHVQHRAGLTVAFHRDGDEVESQVAPTGRDAVKTALMMIVRQEYLQDGDRLTVTEAK